MSNQTDFEHGNLHLTYRDLPNQIPQITSVIFMNRNLETLIDQTIFSTLVGTRKTQPFEELVYIDSTFRNFAFKYFAELTVLENVRHELAVGCADFFFSHVCKFYWNLVCNVGSKNMANAFLRTVCNIVDKWEKKTGNEIHKGTPYYFLTFGFLQEGDVDSAFASMFKAIDEDEKSKDPILGVGAYKMSPAYKYVSLIDDKYNFLYGSITELRKMVRKHISIFNKNITVLPRFSISKLDSRFLQNDDRDIEQIKYLFTYCLEKIRAYLKQMRPLPENDFYKIRNAHLFFNLGLITDKILEKTYKQTFRSHVKRRDMTMNDGIALLFEDKGWIGPLSVAQKKDPRRSLNFRPNLPKDPTDLIDKLLIRRIAVTCNNRPLNFEMRVMQLAVKLRNFAGHNIRKQDVFVKEYPKIVTWLLSSIFVAISVMSYHQRRGLGPARTPTGPGAVVNSTTTTTYYTSSQIPVTSMPPMGTVGPYENQPED